LRCDEGRRLLRRGRCASRESAARSARRTRAARKRVSDGIGWGSRVVAACLPRGLLNHVALPISASQVRRRRDLSHSLHEDPTLSQERPGVHRGRVLRWLEEGADRWSCGSSTSGTYKQGDPQVRVGEARAMQCGGSGLGGVATCESERAMRSGRPDGRCAICADGRAVQRAALERCKSGHDGWSRGDMRYACAVRAGLAATQGCAGPACQSGRQALRWQHECVATPTDGLTARRARGRPVWRWLLGTCEPGSKKCGTNNDVLTWRLHRGCRPRDCVRDSACVSGACSGSCAPGTQRCDAQMPQLCSAKRHMAESGGMRGVRLVCRRLRRNVCARRQQCGTNNDVL